MANAEGSIANIRTAKADKSEVASIAQQSLRATWQADAQAKADKAKTDAVAQSKAEIDVVSRTVAGVNNKLSATHTIKTQVVGGGRTAIAGIALGASSDGKTAESSVIVMADKFGVVKNAADGTVQNVFTIADGNTALSGNIAVKGDVLGSRFIGGEIDISGKDGVLKVGRTGSFLMRASNQNRGLVMNNDQIIVYDERGVVRVKIGRLL